MSKKTTIFIFATFIIGLLPTAFLLAQNTTFSKTLWRGSSGEDVTRLQKFLKAMPDIYPEGLATGYFGALTEKAVKRFQNRRS